jgi:hypothetical protein
VADLSKVTSIGSNQFHDVHGSGTGGDVVPGCNLVLNARAHLHPRALHSCSIRHITIAQPVANGDDESSGGGSVGASGGASSAGGAGGASVNDSESGTNAECVGEKGAGMVIGTAAFELCMQLQSIQLPVSIPVNIGVSDNCISLGFKRHCARSHR